MSNPDTREMQKKIIVLQSKIRKKDDKISELEKKLEDLYLKLKNKPSGGGSDQDFKDLKEERDRYRKVNIELRERVDDLNNSVQMLKIKTEKISPIKKVSAPGASPAAIPVSPDEEREINYLKEQLKKKDDILTSVQDQIESLLNQGAGSSSYMQIRRLNMEIRELKSSLDMAKKSEALAREEIRKLRREKVEDEEFEW